MNCANSHINSINMDKAYKARIDFNWAECWWLWNRIIEILNIINKELGHYHWYIGDIITNEWYLSKDIKDGTYYFENWDAVISIINKDKQYIWGVFVAIENKLGISINLTAENNEDMQIRNSIFELRAFDGRYFEVYTLNWNIYSKLKIRFNEYFYPI